MPEWWTYRLSDFLMFSPAVYWRMVERYNREMWPLQWVMLGVGGVLAWQVILKRRQAGKLVAGMLAALWLWVAWAFHWERYAAINWGAQYLAAAGVLQALMLSAWLVLPRRIRVDDPRPGARFIGVMLALAGLAYPCAALFAGRPWTQAEVFGLMPDPTALTTMGLILASPLPRSVWLLVIPVLTFAAGMLTRCMLSG